MRYTADFAGLESEDEAKTQYSWRRHAHCCHW